MCNIRNSIKVRDKNEKEEEKEEEKEKRGGSRVKWKRRKWRNAGIIGGGLATKEEQKKTK